MGSQASRIGGSVYTPGPSFVRRGMMPRLGGHQHSNSGPRNCRDERTAVLGEIFLECHWDPATIA